MEESDVDPASIAKHADVIKASLEDVGKLDIIVCGNCNQVYHFVEDFNLHKAQEVCDRKKLVGDLVEEEKKQSSVQQVWAFCLWKNAQRSRRELSSWKLYQEWAKLPDNNKEAWIVAGKAVQCYTSLSHSKIQEQFEEGNIEGTNSSQLPHATSEEHHHMVDADDSIEIKEENLSEAESMEVGSVEEQESTVIHPPSPVAPPLLKSAITMEPPLRVTKQPTKREMSTASTEDEYVVEKILAKRFNPRKKQFEYLLKWEGYPHEQNTWEPVRNMSTCTELVASFERNLAKQKAAQDVAKKSGSINQKSTSKMDTVPGEKTGSPITLPGPSSMSSRPVRTSKKKALAQVRSWCGSMSKRGDVELGKKKEFESSETEDEPLGKRLKVDTPDDDDWSSCMAGSPSGSSTATEERDRRRHPISNLLRTSSSKAGTGIGPRSKEHLTMKKTPGRPRKTQPKGNTRMRDMLSLTKIRNVSGDSDLARQLGLESPNTSPKQKLQRAQSPQSNSHLPVDHELSIDALESSNTELELRSHVLDSIVSDSQPVSHELHALETGSHSPTKVFQPTVLEIHSPALPSSASEPWTPVKSPESSQPGSWSSLQLTQSSDGASPFKMTQSSDGGRSPNKEPVSPECRSPAKTSLSPEGRSPSKTSQSVTAESKSPLKPAQSSIDDASAAHLLARESKSPVRTSPLTDSRSPMKLQSSLVDIRSPNKGSQSLIKTSQSLASDTRMSVKGSHLSVLEPRSQAKSSQSMPNSKSIRGGHPPVLEQRLPVRTLHLSSESRPSVKAVHSSVLDSRSSKTLQPPVLVANSKGVVKVDPRQLPNLSSGVYIVAKDGSNNGESQSALPSKGKMVSVKQMLESKIDSGGQPSVTRKPLGQPTAGTTQAGQLGGAAKPQKARLPLKSTTGSSPTVASSLKSLMMHSGSAHIPRPRIISSRTQNRPDLSSGTRSVTPRSNSCPPRLGQLVTHSPSRYSSAVVPRANLLPASPQSSPVPRALLRPSLGTVGLRNAPVGIPGIRTKITSAVKPRFFGQPPAVAEIKQITRLRPPTKSDMKPIHAMLGKAVTKQSALPSLLPSRKSNAEKTSGMLPSSLQKSRFKSENERMFSKSSNKVRGRYTIGSPEVENKVRDSKLSDSDGLHMEFHQDSDSDSDDGLPDFPMDDLQVIVPDSPPRPFTLCPVTGKILGKAEGEHTPIPSPEPILPDEGGSQNITPGQIPSPSRDIEQETLLKVEMSPGGTTSKVIDDTEVEDIYIDTLRTEQGLTVTKIADTDVKNTEDLVSDVHVINSNVKAAGGISVPATKLIIDTGDMNSELVTMGDGVVYQISTDGQEVLENSTGMQQCVYVTTENIEGEGQSAVLTLDTAVAEAVAQMGPEPVTLGERTGCSQFFVRDSDSNDDLVMATVVEATDVEGNPEAELVTHVVRQGELIPGTGVMLQTEMGDTVSNSGSDLLTHIVQESDHISTAGVVLTPDVTDAVVSSESEVLTQIVQESDFTSYATGVVLQSEISAADLGSQNVLPPVEGGKEVITNAQIVGGGDINPETELGFVLPSESTYAMDNSPPQVVYQLVQEGELTPGSGKQRVVLLLPNGQLMVTDVEDATDLDLTTDK